MSRMFDPQSDGPIINHFAGCKPECVTECRRDCNACLRDFEETQRQVEILRLALRNSDGTEHNESWVKVREAVRQAIFDVVPATRLLDEVPGESVEFRQGWNRCCEEIQRRVDALLVVI